MSADEVLNALYEQHLPFRLYADHKHGLTVEELACLSNKPVYWVEERIEAMRLCLEKQIRFDLTSGLATATDAIWREQVWDLNSTTNRSLKRRSAPRQNSASHSLPPPSSELFSE
jgi:hypothetical protein